MTRTAEVLEEVFIERKHQREKWGNDHDDTHDPRNFAEFIAERTTRIINEYRSDKRHLYVEIAALAVAAVEALDRFAEPAKAQGGGGEA